MANPKGNPANLRVGNPGNSGGRPPSAARRRREEFLAALENADSVKAPGKTLWDDALEALAGLLAEGDGPTVRWYVDQLAGTAKTTTEVVVQETEVFLALGRILPEFFETADACKAFLERLKAELGASA